MPASDTPTAVVPHEDVEALVHEAQQGNALSAFGQLLRQLSPDAAWHLMRRTGVGGSDVARILGLVDYDGARPIDVYLEKIGEARPRDESEPMRWGKILEPVIAHEYQRRHGGAKQCYLDGPFDPQRHRSRSWHLYTIDRLVLRKDREAVPRAGAADMPTPDMIVRVLEIKARGWRRLADYGDEQTDDIPFADLCQGAWYVAGLDHDGIDADFAVLFNTHQLREFHYERDHDLEAALLEQVDTFWRRHVTPRVPPPADGSKSFSRYLQQRFAKQRSELLTPSDDVLEMASKLRAITCLAKVVDDAKQKLQQQLADVIGDASGIDFTAQQWGRMLYKFDSRGRVNHSAVAEELARRLGMGPKALKALQDDHRYDAPRRFMAPYNWRKDRLANPEHVLGLLNDKLLAAKDGDDDDDDT